MPYITFDGVRLQAERPEQVAEELHAIARQQAPAPDRLEDYMAEIAFRAREWNGTEVDTSDPARFAETMMRGGLLHWVA
jgi:hypothetical protein